MYIAVLLTLYGINLSLFGEGRSLWRRWWQSQEGGGLLKGGRPNMFLYGKAWMAAKWNTSVGIRGRSGEEGM